MNNNLPQVYQDFLLTLPGKTELNLSEINTLFNLHNNFVDLYNPEYATGCQDCIKRVIEKIKSFFPADEIILAIIPPIEPEPLTEPSIEPLPITEEEI